MFWILVFIVVLVLFDLNSKKRQVTHEEKDVNKKRLAEKALGDQHVKGGSTKQLPDLEFLKKWKEKDQTIDWESSELFQTLTGKKKKTANENTDSSDSLSQQSETGFSPSIEELNELRNFLNNEDRLNSNPLAAAVQKRGIRRLLHFTKAENLKSIGAHGILSVASMRQRRVGYLHNDDMRLDAKLNGISLSITHPNSLMFYKYRQKNAGAWAVLELNPSAIYDFECQFCYTNAASNKMKAHKIEELTGIKAFERMFEGSLKPEYPTDVQAEILCFSDIPVKYITTVYVENSWYHRQVEKMQLPFPVKVDRTLFEQRSH